VAKTKIAPAKSKEPTTPKARSISGVAALLASSVHAKAKVLSEALPYM